MITSKFELRLIEHFCRQRQRRSATLQAKLAEDITTMPPLFLVNPQLPDEPGNLVNVFVSRNIIKMCKKVPNVIGFICIWRSFKCLVQELDRVPLALSNENNRKLQQVEGRRRKQERL